MNLGQKKKKKKKKKKGKKKMAENRGTKYRLIGSYHRINTIKFDER